MGEARENPSVDFGENEEQERCRSEAQERGKESPRCYMMDICHLRNAELEQKHKHTKDESCSEETSLNMTQVHTRYSQNKDRQLRK